ncbi:Eco57I restriction-modification methylase domain-containing protein [Mycobacterium asiaticum]|uniref:Eco57I restriction-modification methylase domain-containing protein n=1 Tax=Mycobacterium asiaticum TaxID=1790 RepID=UPI0007EFCDE5|nr:DNA methyltransferase [Mycobacterium asiaticum]OBI92885.1 type II restriction endonuclease subunit M [Mycobacterium asiaticum]
MAPRTLRQRSTPNISELHRAWLELVDTDGPFLAIAPLKRVWPQGIPALAGSRREALFYARKDFEAAWEASDRNTVDSASAMDAYRIARDKWVETVLRDVAGWAESLSWGPVAGISAQSPNRAVTVGAQAALLVPDGAIGALVSVIDPVDSLRQVPADLWAATPVDRMEVLLRDNDIPIGIVTDGRWWAMVCARPGAMTASGVVDALTWVEEPRTRDAFLTLISRQHIIGGNPSERLPVLFEQSVAAAEEITEALGAQVRRAVELLIQSFSESARDAHQRGEDDPLPTDTHQSYEAAVTVMMRIVFLLFAEERGLLPSGELFEQGYGISGELDRLQAREAEESEEALDATSLTWHRLLATSQALYGGASFENMRVPAYGGSLFDPARFPFLTALTAHGTLAIAVSDRVMLHALRSVQQAILKGGEARRISFRDIDVEQIGYIYEGLLGYTAVTVDETYLGLQGTRGEEPEITLTELERLVTAHTAPKKLADAILAYIEDDQPSAKPQSAAAIAKGIGASVDPSVVSGLAQAVGDDHALRERVLPWLGILRLDLRGRPFVVLDGGLLVKETPSRKNAGAHYTPKSLAREVVLHALQPLCYAPGPYQTAEESQWKLKSSDELLSLKVADIACGSGAFLVSAASYLADRVVEAWTAEDPANVQRTDLHRRAIRAVVANCLYGADINDMAVEMCKLSLWLVSLDRDLPFSFVDDKIFLGNSLLGLTDLKQLRKLHVDPSRVPAGEMFDIFDVDIDAIVHQAADLRRKLATEIDENDPARNSAAKRRQMAQLREVTAALRKIADGIVAAGLPHGGKPGRALDEAYENLRIAVKAAHLYPGHPDSAMLDAIIDTGLTPTVPTDYLRWQPNHWVIEAPDVMAERGGFDAIIGNPPFLGGVKVGGAIGGNLRDWFANILRGGTTKGGQVDLVAYFLLRAYVLLRPRGVLGLIATNTLAQGDTRHAGLDELTRRGFTITRAIRSKQWPVSTVNLMYSAVWGVADAQYIGGARIADGVVCRAISTLLEPEGRVTGTPLRLSANAGKSFLGVSIMGMGFAIDPSTAAEWIARDEDNVEVLFPFLNGDELNNRPDSSATRWIIDFRERSEADARRYELPFSHVFEQVRPERLRGSDKGAREYWWRFLRSRPALRLAIGDLREVLVITVVSKNVMPMRVQTKQVFSNALAIFATDSYSVQAVMSSAAHQLWAIKYGSGMRNDPRYTPSDVFETFPFPCGTTGLEEVGRKLDNDRREIMLRRGFGLTRLYNLINDPQIANLSDPDVAHMRAVHVELDEAVINAYGWSDIPLDHGFHTFRQMQRWTVNPAAQVEILDRLLEENHRRAAEETKQTSNAKSKGRRGKSATDEQGTLL